MRADDVSHCDCQAWSIQLVVSEGTFENLNSGRGRVGVCLPKPVYANICSCRVKAREMIVDKQKKY